MLTAPTTDGKSASGDLLRFTVASEQADGRLDAVAAAGAPGLSRTRVKALIAAGQVTVDGGVVRDANRRLKRGEAIAVAVPPATEAVPRGETLPLAIVFEDEHLIVIDKPAGLVVHPAPGHEDGTLLNALIAHCGASLSGIGGVKRPGIVHRLDKDTSGLLVVAKTDGAHGGLAALFADHGRTMPLLRAYHVLVWGRPDRAAGTVEAALGRHGTDRQRMAVVAEGRGRAAITHWHLNETFLDDAGAPVASLLTCTLETGRTHQIRVHMGHLGLPVVGDPVYGRGFRSKAARLAAPARAALDALARQALHAAILGFPHPVTGVSLRFESALPPDLDALLRAVRR